LFANLRMSRIANIGIRGDRELEYRKLMYELGCQMGNIYDPTRDRIDENEARRRISEAVKALKAELHWPLSFMIAIVTLVTGVIGLPACARSEPPQSVQNEESTAIPSSGQRESANEQHQNLDSPSWRRRPLAKTHTERWALASRCTWQPGPLTDGQEQLLAVRIATAPWPDDRET